MKLTINFTREEFDCRNGTAVPARYMANVTRLAQNLQVLRDHLGKAVHVNSGYRTPAYNAAVGGVKSSQHLLAKAADITVRDISPTQLHRIILQLIKDKKIQDGGVGLYPGFVHYDVRSVPARW